MSPAGWIIQHLKLVYPDGGFPELWRDREIEPRLFYYPMSSRH
jgi:hypothetical protein